MKFIKKLSLLFNNAKLIKEYEDMQKILKMKDDLITDQAESLKEYEIFTEQDNLLARIRDYEGLLEHYHGQKREYKAEIIQLKQDKINLKQEIADLKKQLKK